MFNLLSKHIALPLAKLLLKSYLCEPAAIVMGGLLEIAHSKISDGLACREAARQFESLADRICTQLVPIFERESRRGDLNVEAVAFEISRTLEGQVAAAGFIKCDLDPVAVETLLKDARPLPPGMLGDAETQLYERALAEAVRYLLGVVHELPQFVSQYEKELLVRTSQLIGSITKTLEAIGRIEQGLSLATTASAIGRFEADYRQAVLRQLDYVELFGADLLPEAQRHALSVAYISLSVQEGGNGIISPVDTVLDDFDLEGNAGRLLIRGSAGSGKSTLFRWIALEAAKNLRSRAANGQWRMCAPFLIRLRDYPSGRLPSPKEFLSGISGLSKLPLENWVEMVLTAGRGVVLFDGVDEVSPYQRAQLRDEIITFVEAYPAALYLISTRPEGVEDGWLRKVGFREVKIEPMIPQDRDRFIDKWHKAVGQRLADSGRMDDTLPDLAAKLKASLGAYPAIARLATNPLLCAMICALHRDRREHLPQSQVELTEDLCRMLLHRREVESGLNLQAFPEAYRKLDYERKRMLVRGLAVEMVASERQTLPVETVEQRIGSALGEMQGYDPAEAPTIRKTLVERSGMLRENRPEHIDFIHNTFKDYLAAERFITGYHFNLLCRHALEPSWRQVVLFAAATRHPKIATKLIKRLLLRANMPWHFAVARQYRILALNCRVMALQLDRRLLRRLDAIQKKLFPPNTAAEAEALAMAGDGVVPFLKMGSDLTDQQAAACVHALRLIGTEEAKAVAAGYQADERMAVLAELAALSDVCSIPALYRRLIAGETLPDGIRVQIADITPLKQEKDVRKLQLGGSSIKDIAPLAGLKELEHLDLSKTAVADLSPLKSLTELRHLDLAKTQVADLEPLAGLSNLTHLNLSATQITNLFPLAGLSSLEYLDIGNTAVSDVAPLVKLSRLQDINIVGSRIRKEDLRLLANFSVTIPIGRAGDHREVFDGFDHSPDFWIQASNIAHRG